MLFKLLIPFVALSAVSSAINRTLRLPHLGLFLVSSVLVEFLTITVSFWEPFFFLFFCKRML